LQQSSLRLSKESEEVHKYSRAAFALLRRKISGELPMALMIRASAALMLAGVMLAGCSGDNGVGFTTGALGSQTAAAPETKVDPVCVTLASRIEALRKEGIADKIEKAAAKKYKMTHGDLMKADQLTKASAEFQGHCSTMGPTTAQAPSGMPASTAATASAPKSAASHATTVAATQPGSQN
jgi:hypothetical protein